MKNFALAAAFALALLFDAQSAHAKAERVSPALEKEVIDQVDEMAADAWEESDVFVKVDAVLYDADAQTAVVIYESRSGKQRKYERQKPIVVHGIPSEKAIIDQAPNGYRSLNMKISYALIDVIG